VLAGSAEIQSNNLRNGASFENLKASWGKVKRDFNMASNEHWHVYFFAAT